MTKTEIKKAFKALDPAAQAEVLGELASSLAESLATLDRLDAGIFRSRRHEEKSAAPLADVKRRVRRRTMGN